MVEVLSDNLENNVGSLALRPKQQNNLPRPTGYLVGTQRPSRLPGIVRDVGPGYMTSTPSSAFYFLFIAKRDQTSILLARVGDQ